MSTGARVGASAQPDDPVAPLRSHGSGPAAAAASSVAPQPLAHIAPVTLQPRPGTGWRPDAGRSSPAALGAVASTSIRSRLFRRRLRRDRPRLGSVILHVDRRFLHPVRPGDPTTELEVLPLDDEVWAPRTAHR
jgi:hypothetical protein